MSEKEQPVPKFAKGPGARKVAELVNFSKVVLLPITSKKGLKALTLALMLCKETSNKFFN